MSNKELYNWQNFVDGIQEYGNDDDVLLEMKQDIINFLSNDIKMAESGKDHTMPFNDIFGLPDTENPKTRMIIPYGNQDIQKMKILMLDIWNKLYEEYNKNQNISVQSILWSNKKEIVKQQRKPQGWVEGDPIPTIEKQVGSPVVKVTYNSKLGDQKERKVELSFGKLLQKYFPQEMQWWQGDKKKDISGKQSFFTQNVETMNQIVRDVTNNDEETIRNESVQDRVVIFSRHPIDVVRMSDFDLLEYSCHSQKGSFFKCAVEEAKRSANGGGVLFMVSKEKFDKAFPDGQMPQTGDLFNDSDRDIDDKFDAQATSRLRVRRVIDTSTNTEYAVPDTRMYGLNPEAFRKETFAYFANSQKNKFIDPNTGKPIFPNPDNLERFGGSYEDGGESKIGSNFALLMKTTYQQQGIYSELERSIEYNGVVNKLNMSSISWAGSERSESRNPGGEGEQYCEEFEQELNTAFNRAKRDLSYFEVPDIQYECDGAQEYTYIFGLTAFVKIQISADRFPNLNIKQIQNVLRNHDYGDEYSGNTSLRWPNLALQEDNIEVMHKPSTGMVEIYMNYSEDEIESIRDIQSALRDLAQFEGQIDYDDYTREIEWILEKNELLGQAGITSKQEQVQDLIDTLEDTEFEVEQQSTKKIRFEYVKELMVKNISDYQESIDNSRSLNILQNEFKNQFQFLFSKRAAKAFEEIQKQLPLFNKGEQQQVSGKYLIPRIYEVNFRMFPTTYGTFDAPRKIYKIGYTFVVTLDTTLSEEEVMASVAFIKEIANNTEILDDLAIQAVNSELAPYLKESKKRNSSKLIKEGAGNNKIWRIKINH